MSLARKTSWSAVASVLSLLGRLLAGIIIARALGTDGTGRVAYLVWLADTGNILTNAGLQFSLTRYLAKLSGPDHEREGRGLAQWIFRRYLALSVLGVGITAGLAGLSDSPTLTAPIWTLLALLFLARGLQAIYQAYLTGIQRFDMLARVNVFSGLSLVVGMAVGVYFFGLQGALGGYVVGALVPATCSFTMLRGGTGAIPPSSESCRQVWRYALHTWFAAIVSAFVWSRMEIVIIEWYWNDHEVAMFAVGHTFAMLITQTAVMLSGAFLPHFAELSNNDGNNVRIAATYASGTRLLALILFPMALGGAAVMPVVLPMLYGAEFAPAVPNAIVLVASSCLLFSSIASSLIYGLGRSSFIAWGGTLGAIAAILVGFAVIPVWGAWGAVWSRTIVQISMVGLGTWYIAYRIGVNVPVAALCRTLVSAGFCAGTASVIIARTGNPLILLVAIPAGALVYLFALRYLHALHPDDSPRLAQALTLLPVPLRRRATSVLNWAGGVA